MNGFKYRLTAIGLTLMAAIAVLAVFSFRAWVQIERFKPTYDLVITLDAPRAIGCFAAYFNEQYNTPAKACLTHDGETELVLSNIPASIATIRMDLGEQPGMPYTIRSIGFATSRSYAAAPGFVIRNYRPEEFSRWSQYDVTIEPNGRTVAKSYGPLLLAALKLDLGAGTPPNPNKPIVLRRLSPAVLTGLALALVATFALGILFIRQFGKSPSPDRHAATLAGVCALGFALTIVTAFPGHTTFDDLYNLTQYLMGQLGDIHPALGTITWVGLMNVGRLLGLSPLWQAATKLIVQAAIFWCAAFVLLHFFKTRWIGYLAGLALALCPGSLVYLGHLNNDSGLGIAFFAAVTCMTVAVWRKSILALLLALPFFFYGVAIRANAGSAALPLCFFWVAILFDIRGIDLGTRRRRIAAAAISFAMLVFFVGATLVISRAAIVVRCCFGQQVFMTAVNDLLGVSVRVQRNLVPPEIYQDPNYSLDTIKKNFDVKSLNWDGLAMLQPSQYRLVMGAWLGAIRDYPGAFFAHRLETLAWVFGFHTGPAPAGYMSRFYVGSRAFRLPVRPQEIVDEYEHQSPQFFRVRDWSEKSFALTAGWPIYKIWIYFLVMGLLFLFPVANRRALLDPVTWLWWSAVFYTLPYILLQNSAQFRYLYWTALALFLAAAFRLDAVVDHRRSRNANRSAPDASLGGIKA